MTEQNGEQAGKVRPHLTDAEAAALIRVVLQAEPELPIARLAEELCLTEYQLGMGLGLLVRSGEAKIRQEPEGLVVYALRVPKATDSPGSRQGR